MSNATDDGRKSLGGTLHWTWRIALVLFGIASMLLSVALYDSPPLRVTATGVGTPGESRQTAPADPTTYSVALLTLGGLCLLLGVNGRKISRLSSGGVDMDGPTDEQVADDAKHAGVDVKKDEAPPPAAVARPESTFTKDGEEYQVYEPEDIPTTVIEDLRGADKPPIKSLGDVSYGFRRIGQGNHAWFVKTKRGTTLQVSYGGRGKDSETVKQVG